jgi:hypothetical protein
VEYPYGLEYVEYGVCECGDGFGMVVGWNMLEEWWTKKKEKRLEQWWDMGNMEE